MRSGDPGRHIGLKGNFEVVKVLIASHADIDSLTQDGRKPLDIAIEYRHDQILSYLAGAVIHRMSQSKEVREILYGPNVGEIFIAGILLILIAFSCLPH